MKNLTEPYCRISVVVQVAFHFIKIPVPLKQEIFRRQRTCAMKVRQEVTENSTLLFISWGE